MKYLSKLLLLFCLFLPNVGCDTFDGIINIPKPTPFVAGMVECPTCCGEGVLEDADYAHCPACDGFGKMNEVEMGKLVTYNIEFIRGYTDQEKGILFKKCPYILKKRANCWREGWKVANKN